jgi:leucyl-tRNA synthetase/predicted alpha/beta hydrolase family esterase
MEKEKLDPSSFESKWIQKWLKDRTYKTPDLKDGDSKFYSLYSFPYPSGAGLHVGHVEGMVANDVPARYSRMKGKSVLMPMGWDSFGLPAENYAIKTGIHPKTSTEEVIVTFTKQVQSLGISVDWDTEVGAHWPSYYKWTQWLFLELFKAGLAYKKAAPVNWCPKDQTVLANEQVIDGKCERCDTPVIQKDMEQWFFRITKFAEDLYKDLSDVDWPESTKSMQRNWIGRSEGSIIRFGIKTEDRSAVEEDDYVEVFSTRVDTIFSCTYLVVAPEHSILQEYKQYITNYDEVLKYIEETKLKTDLDRQTSKDKTGVEIKGIKVINPATSEEIPLWTADFVIGTYGTGAVFADGHDERDFEFATKFGIPLKASILPKEGDRYIGFISKKWSNDFEKLIKNLEAIEAEFKVKTSDDVLFVIPEKSIDKFIEFASESVKGKNAWHDVVGKEAIFIFGDGEVVRVPKFIEDEVVLNKLKALESSISKYKSIWEMLYNSDYKEFVCYTSDGVLYASGGFNGLESEEARIAITRWLEEREQGYSKITYRLRDWLVSRQRYWGAPIPMIYSEKAKSAGFGYIPKEKLNVLVLHGWGSDSDDNWFPWLKSELTSLGYNVEIANLPNTDVPDLSEQLKYIEETYSEWLKEPEKLVVVGHSSGGYLGIKLAEKYPVAKVIGVAASFAEDSGDYPADIAEKNSKGVASLIESYKSLGVPSQEKLASENTELVFFYSADDLYLRKDLQDIFRNAFPKGLFKDFADRGHFGSGTNTTRIDELLYFINIKNNTEMPGIFPVLESELPVELPDDVDFMPTGESPLAGSKSFSKDVKCPIFGTPAVREIDTMDTFVDSSWYFFRHVDPKNESSFADSEKLNRWLPTDLYMIGAEHTVLHLLYARFFTKFLKEKGLISFHEPFQKLRHMGTVLGSDGRKMSKRWGNVINPTDEIKKYGADTVRLYEMFMGPLEETKPWNDRSQNGVFRFLNKLWDLQFKLSESESSSQKKELNKLIKKVSEDIESLSFNTAVAKFMEFVNFLMKEETINKKIWEELLKLLAPFAPHITEEMWHRLGYEESVHLQKWPEYDESLISEEKVNIAVQVNGRLRSTIQVEFNATEEAVKSLAIEDEKVKKYVSSEIKKVIFVQNRIINFIV